MADRTGGGRKLLTFSDSRQAAAFFAPYVETVFFFQAEDGIRDWSVTGVQTCALPISADSACKNSTPGWCKRNRRRRPRSKRVPRKRSLSPLLLRERRIPRRRPGSPGHRQEIGRASCRERVGSWAGGV